MSNGITDSVKDELQNDIKDDLQQRSDQMSVPKSKDTEVKKYSLQDIFKNAFIIQDEAENEKFIEQVLRDIPNMDDYFSSLFYTGIAIEILKSNFKINVVDTSKQDDIFLKNSKLKDKKNIGCYLQKDNTVIIGISEGISDVQMILKDQFAYKWLNIIDLKKHDRRNLYEILDEVKENILIFEEELTQNEIKMLEWIDEKIVNFLQESKHKNDYITDLKFMDSHIWNMVSSHMMWGRTLERLEIMSQILTPLEEYIGKNILSKFENYILSEDNLKYLDKIEVPHYLKLKLELLSLLDNKKVNEVRKDEIVKDIRMLNLPKQTEKNIKKIHFLSEMYLNEKNKNKNFFEKTEKRLEYEKNIYLYSIEQRKDEILAIEKKIKKLSKENDKESIVQLLNVSNIINDEKVELEHSIKVIKEKINFIKKVGAQMDFPKKDMENEELINDLKVCAEELLNIKLNNNRLGKWGEDIINDFEKNNAHIDKNDINFEYMKFLTELKKRSFELKTELLNKDLDVSKNSSREYKKIKIMEPKDKEVSNKKKSVDKSKSESKEF